MALGVASGEVIAPYVSYEDTEGAGDSEMERRF